MDPDELHFVWGDCFLFSEIMFLGKWWKIRNFEGLWQQTWQRFWEQIFKKSIWQIGAAKDIVLQKICEKVAGSSVYRFEKQNILIAW